MNGLSYPQRLTKLKLDLLEARRLETDFITMFKILHHIIDKDFNEFFTLSRVTNTRGHRFKLAKPLNRTNVNVFSFASRRIDCWNFLPDSIFKSNSVTLLSKNLQNIDLSKYLILSF
jgi:hypothetical protein